MMNNYPKIEEWFKANLDWKLLNSMVWKAMRAVCTVSYFDKFNELHPSELGVTDWNIIHTAFKDLEVLYIDKEEKTEFYICELGIIGSSKLAFVGESGLIYMDDVEFSTFYTIIIRDENFICYQGEFYPEEIGFIINYKALRVR